MIVPAVLSAFLLSYILGSIPWGHLLGKMAGKDIRLEGSKNIGATNLWRVCGWRYGLAGFLLDFAKGLVAVLLFGGIPAAGLPHPWQGILAAVGAVLGHNFPVWLRFRGGKGVAASAGAAAGLMWLPFAVAMAAFLLTVLLFRYISLGSMVAGCALVAACLLLLPEPLGADAPLCVLAALLCLMILLRHRQNIGRILNGTENRFPPPKK